MYRNTYKQKYEHKYIYTYRNTTCTEIPTNKNTYIHAFVFSN